MSQIAWNCQLLDLSRESGEAQAKPSSPPLGQSSLGTVVSVNESFTVGKVLNLTCEGAIESLNKDHLIIKKSDKSDSLSPLSLLKVKNLDSQHVELIVTSYIVGEHSSREVVLTDGENFVSLGDFSWKVESVISQEQQQPPQPFSPFPMLKMSYPLWFWILLFLIVATVIIIPIKAIRTFKARRLAFEDLKNLETPLMPLDHFYKELRKLEKSLDRDQISAPHFTDILKRNFKIYLSRSLKIPAHLWREGDTFKEIRRKYPKFYRECGDSLGKCFLEISKIQEQVQKKDCDYLVRLTQGTAEEIDRFFKKKDKRFL